MSQPNLSHQILNKLDDVKQKLTDMEYKNLTELLLEHHNKSDDMYEMTVLIPFIENDSEMSSSECECCNRPLEYLNLDLKQISFSHKININIANDIIEKIGNKGLFKLTFSHSTFNINHYTEREVKKCFDEVGLLVEILRQMRQRMMKLKNLFISEQSIFITKLTKI